MLRRWGEGLTTDDREEVRAAGRAILLLSDEVERLHIDLWHALDEKGPAQEPERPAEASVESYGPTAAEVSSTLRDRISAFASRAHKQ